jgi:hypothetical protein
VGSLGRRSALAVQQRRSHMPRAVVPADTSAAGRQIAMPLV